MANILLSPYGAFTQIVTDQEPANNGLIVSSEINNTSGSLYVDLECQATFGTNPSAGGYIACYLIMALNGTDYADGADGSVVPPATSWVCNFPLRAVTTAQKVAVSGIRVPPAKFKFVLENKSGQTVSTNTLQLYYRSYSEMTS